DFLLGGGIAADFADSVRVFGWDDRGLRFAPEKVIPESGVAGGFEFSERFHVVDVVFAFRSFEAKRKMGEGRMVENGFETFPADFAFSEQFVAVETGTESAFAVVDVDADDFFPRNLRGEFGDEVLDSGFGGNVVTGGEQVAGVEADGEPFGSAEFANEIRDMLDAGAEIGALSGGDFECDLGVAVVTVENP